MSGQKNDAEVAILKFKVLGQDNVQHFFRVRDNTPMMIVKKSIARDMGVQVGSVTLIFDGRKISDEATPSQLDLEDDDLLELYYVNN